MEERRKTLRVSTSRICGTSFILKLFFIFFVVISWLRWRGFAYGKGERECVRIVLVCECRRVLGLQICLIVVMASSGFKIDFKKFDGKENFIL